MKQPLPMMIDDPPSTDARHPRLIEGVLANLPLFLDVARVHVTSVACQSMVRNASRGAALFRRGDRLPGIIVFAYGSAKLALRRNDGAENVVRFVGAGDAFGEAAALHGQPCPVDVVMLSESMLVVVPPAPLLRLLDRDPRFARNLVRLLSEKNLGLLVELEARLQQSAMQRLAAYLESLARPNGTPDTWIVRLPASKTAVAARLGITKETMSRLLRELANRGLIAVDRRDIEVRDRTALAQIAR